MLQEGNTMPEFKYTDIQGNKAELSHLWKNQKVLIIWLRHFGCRFYAEAGVKLPNLQKELQKLGINLACVVQGTPEEAKMFFTLDTIECIPDSHKESYKLLGLERTSWFQILFPTKALRKRREEATKLGCSISAKGTKQKSSDPLQLPGAALINEDGKLLWIHRAKHTGDLALGDELIAELKKSLGVV